MKKTALALAIPLAVIGAGVAGAWYTGTRVEPEITRALAHANSELQKAAPEAGLQVTLLDLERGLFASEARYRISLPDANGGEPRSVVITDHLEHGPFPLSRLAQGKLLPVMAHSHVSLERTPFTEPLFAAAGGQPFTGETSIGYDGSLRGDSTLAALAFDERDASLRLSPTRVTVEMSGDYRTSRVDARLAEVDLTGVEPDSGALVRVEARDLVLQADKTLNDAGFTLGPGQFTAKRVTVQAGSVPAVTLHDAVVEEALTENGERLQQTLAYRIGQLDVQDQPVGGVTLALSARQLDPAALKQLAERYNEIALDRIDNEGGFGGDLTPGQEAALKAQLLRLLDGQPTLALDELSLKTANGEARLSVTADLRQPAQATPSLDAAPESALAALKAHLSVDKPLIGDLATLQARLAGAPNDPALLQQQATAASELFSGIALNSGWAQLQGDTLTSSLTYANDRVNFNGQEMSVEEFVRSVMGSVGGMGMH